ncbi:MAG: tetratricopeptide repeat protein [Acidobacteria bacterium]|nr:tetratricopeptide repeat protein [Acidobacteriota bacterium]MCG3191772.1 Beta-barrel assembly-enhancing protease [Thermoanaerobaculia bacterium]
MICQVCGLKNPEDSELCERCQSRLLVVSGPPVNFEEAPPPNNEISLDENLLERVSFLEEVVKRTAETLKSVLETQNRQEKNEFVIHTGFLSLKDLLEKKGTFLEDELFDLWEGRIDQHMAALEKRERFLERRERIQAGFSGERIERFRALLSEAEFSFYALDPGKAIRVLEEAWRLDRANLELAFFLAETSFNEGQTERAQGLLKQVLAGDPHHFEALVYMGVLEHDRGHTSRGIELLQTAVGVKPGEFLPYFALGAIQAAIGELTRAEANLKKALEIEPNPRAFALVGTIAFERGRLSDAIEALQEAIRLSPDDEDAIFLLGIAYLERGWTNKAAERFRAALELRPNRIDFKAGLKLLGRSGAVNWPKASGDAARWARKAEEAAASDPERSFRFFRRALDLEPDNPALLLPYALLCSSAGRTAETVSATRHILSRKPPERIASAAYALLLEALRAEGKFREGHRVAEEMLASVRTKHARAIGYCEKAAALAEMGEDLDEALASADSSLRLAPAAIRQFSLAAKGWVHYKRKEFENAVECLRGAVEAGENSPDLVHLGLAYLAVGEVGLARESFEKVRRKGGLRVEMKGGLETRVLVQLRRSLEEAGRPPGHSRPKS